MHLAALPQGSAAAELSEDEAMAVVGALEGLLQSATCVRVRQAAAAALASVGVAAGVGTQARQRVASLLVQNAEEDPERRVRAACGAAVAQVFSASPSEELLLIAQAAESGAARGYAL